MQAVRVSKKWVGFAVLACAACCAVPIAVVFGIGSATAVTGALFAGVDAETVLCLGVLSGLLAGAVYLWLRSRKKKVDAQACSTSCKSDASCCNGKSNTSAN